MKAAGSRRKQIPYAHRKTCRSWFPVPLQTVPYCPPGVDPFHVGTIVLNSWIP